MKKWFPWLLASGVGRPNQPRPYPRLGGDFFGRTDFRVPAIFPGDPLGKNAREIRGAADRAATLTRQLLAYGRKQILQPEILDLNRVISEMASTLPHLIGKEVDVRIVPSVGLKSVKIDPGQMEQVIVNMAMNAAEAMPNGGRLTLETSNVTLTEEFVRPFPGLKPGGYVQLAISATLLQKLGYTVLTANNGIEALSLKNQRDIGHIDLLFTDIVMPHMSGTELSDRIRAIYPGTKILFTSAYTENAIVQQGVLNQGVILLQKPFTPSALAYKVREVLDQSSSI